MMGIETVRYASPARELRIGSYNGSICLCDWVGSRQESLIDRRLCRRLNARYEERESEIISLAVSQLNEYFEGKRKFFSIPLLFAGTEFQKKVWKELMKIPYGENISYMKLAQRIGNPKAVRAVASAVATNPISILVPCHRVIGSDLSLTGYGGGIPAKQWLLDHETNQRNTSNMGELYTLS